jgi:hypothetical protein
MEGPHGRVGGAALERWTRARMLARKHFPGDGSRDHTILVLHAIGRSLADLDFGRLCHDIMYIAPVA